MSLYAHLWRGLRNGYPPCCVLTWVANLRIRDRDPQAIQRGLVETPDGRCWVPCRLHQRHHHWKPVRMVRRNDGTLQVKVG